MESRYGLVCFTLADVATLAAAVVDAFAAVNVELRTLPTFSPALPVAQPALRNMGANWRLSFDRLSALGASDHYDLLAYLDADVVLVDNVDELLTVSGVDFVLTPSMAACVPSVSAMNGINAAVVVFRPSAALLAGLQAFVRDAIDQQDWAVFKISDQSVLAWYLRRTYPGAPAFAAAPAPAADGQDARKAQAASAAALRTSRLGKERVLLVSGGYNMPSGSCACDDAQPTAFRASVTPYVKAWHLYMRKPYAWTPATPLPTSELCFCTLLHAYEAWVALTQRCAGTALAFNMSGMTAVRKPGP